MLVYGDLRSGNCYKVKLTLKLLGIPHDWQHVDVLAGECQQASFLAINPNAKIPALVLDDGRVLCESNAIIWYLANEGALVPTSAFAKAKMFEWMFFEQYSHEPYIAVARFIKHYQGLPPARRAEFASLQAGGNKALTLMEHQLSLSPYLVGASLSLADIALFAYTHVADEGGFDLSRYPNIQAWCERISAQPLFYPMPMNE
ncbi:glutathione S-transferase family protein [Shewanella sp. NIFS-20-20]|uniref:glutathione S-transferase family protein n=1 Tax=Shewanella sp. NIFS-20-20 TaxID=2853806 RepID=UPI001C441F37|nr:glutathione S-transferase family protein [Shewanella sp. NIFS-20-20]MBV7315894.1 glutathione S-transferase family protein [Shewanella sp. NIFS-20-20]